MRVATSAKAGHPALDPARIDADAVRVLGNVERIVERVRSRREALDRADQLDVPLFVLMGEAHTVPEDNVTQMLVLNELQAVERIAYGYELQHNRLHIHFRQCHPETQDATLAERLRERDDDGVFSMKSMAATHGFGFKDHSDGLQVHFLLDKRIRTRFMDVATREGEAGRYVLDHTDYSTVRALRTCFGRAVVGVEARHADGVFARNRHMTDAMIRLAGDTGARIVVQQCGNRHIASAGDVGSQTLPGLLKSAGMPFLAVTRPASFMDRMRFRFGALKRGELAFIDGQNPVTAAYDQISGGPYKNMGTDITSRTADEAYTNALLRGVGLGGYAMSAKQDEHLRQQYRTELEEMFRFLRIA